MSDKNKLDAEMERAAERERRRNCQRDGSEIILRLDARCFASGRYKRILSDCKHPEDSYTPSNNGDAHRYCKDWRHEYSTDFS